MIKLCGKTIVCSLKLTFEASLQGREFPGYWKKANVVPVYKKESKNWVKKYNKPSSNFWKNIWKSDIQGLIQFLA